MAKNIRNLVLFKLGWIACVYFAATGQPFMAALAVAAVAATHLYSAPVMIKEAVLLAVAAVIGMAWESTLVYAGIVSYPDLLLMEVEETNPIHKKLKLIQQSGEKAAAIDIG